MKNLNITLEDMNKADKKYKEEIAKADKKFEEDKKNYLKK